MNATAAAYVIAAARAVEPCTVKPSAMPSGIETKNATSWLTPRRRGRLLLCRPEAVYDASTRQVVRRELELDPVAKQDANAMATHLPGGVSERLVTVLESDAIHAAAERLDDL